MSNYMQVDCDFCGDTIERRPSSIEGKENVFCDRECHRQHQKNLPPEKHNSYKGGQITVECQRPNCDGTKDVKPYRVRTQKWFFCDKKCEGKFKEGRFAGEGNPNYKGGDWEHNYRGANWVPVRNEVRERDNYTCQRCGATMEELGQVPDCHHIRPEHTFDNREDAHYKENLALLCRDCHNRFDNMDPLDQIEELNT